MMICSACLAGMACKYSGKNNNTDSRIVALVENQKVVPVCPEMLGGLSVPRVPCEIKEDKVINCDGEDMTEFFVDGAKKALAIAKAVNATKAILMPRSPSCGIGMVYDGNFQKKLVLGDGVFVKLLKENGIDVFSPDEYFKEGSNE